MELIPGMYYECKKNLIVNGDTYFSKGTQYKAVSETQLADNKDGDHVLSPSIFEQYFKPTPYTESGCPLPLAEILKKAPGTQNLPKDPAVREHW